MVRHRMPFHNLNPLLLTQLAQNPSDLPAQRPLDRSPRVLRHEHDVILAVPFYAGLALPISHDDLLPVWLTGGRSSPIPLSTPERQSLEESTANGGGLPGVS
jgi:hypothetical protein